MTPLFILIGIVVLAALIVMGIYNSLVNLRNRVQEGMSDIGVQQKRRWDLIPPSIRGCAISLDRVRACLRGSLSPAE